MALSTPLQEFIRATEQVLARGWAPAQSMAALRPEFQAVLAEPALLAAEQQASGDGRYAQHVLYCSAEHGFSLVALVWRPSERTPIHDHLAWGLAGVYRGGERETTYAWCDGPDGAAGLRPSGVRELWPGEVTAIVPPADIHDVANALAVPSVSLHLYALDLRTSPTGSSVQATYARELVIEPPLGLTAASR